MNKLEELKKRSKLKFYRCFTCHKLLEEYDIQKRFLAGCVEACTKCGSRRVERNYNMRSTPGFFEGMWWLIRHPWAWKHVIVID